MRAGRSATGFLAHPLAALAGAGLLAFLGVGGVEALRGAAANRYLHHGLRTLFLLDLRGALNGAFLVFVLSGVLVALLIPASGALSGRGRAGTRLVVTACALITLVVVFAMALSVFLPGATFLVRLVPRGRDLTLGLWLSGLARFLFPPGLLAVIAVSLFLAGRRTLARGGATAEVSDGMATAAGMAPGAGSAGRILAVAGMAAVVLLGAFNAALFARQRAGGPEGPNVLLISIDTVRADRLGCYGHARETAPRLSGLAAEGVLFENAYSQAPWTLPAMATLHTSLYPSEHGAARHDRRLDPQHVTLAEVLRNHGYRTIGVVTHNFVSGMYGFRQGFDVLDETFLIGPDEISSPGATDLAMRYLTHNAGRKVFLWIHYFDPHYTYIDHPGIDFAAGYDGPVPQRITIKDLRQRKDSLAGKDLRYVTDVYDEEIFLTDTHIGRLIDHLGEVGMAGNTVIVVTADHGEEFLERGEFGHGKKVYDEQIRVPLILSAPGAPKGRRIVEGVEVRGAGRTILELCGISHPSFGGASLLAPAGGTGAGGAAANGATETGADESTAGTGAANGTRASGADESTTAAPPPAGSGVVFSEGSRAFGRNSPRLAVIRNGWKLIRNLPEGSHELYDLRSDPGERVDRYGAEPGGGHARTLSAAELSGLEAELDGFLMRGRAEAGGVALDPETIERLRSLGYMR